MRKTVVLLCALLLTLSCIGPAMAEEGLRAENGEELYRLLKENAGAEEAIIQCGDALWDTLWAESFGPVYRDGIKLYMPEISVRYSSSRKLLSLDLSKKAAPDSYLWFECETEADAERALGEILTAREKKPAYLLCTGELITSLYQQRGLEALLGRYGYEDCESSAYSGGNYIRISDYEPFELPWYYVTDEGTLDAAAEQAGRAGYSEFMLVCPRELYDRLTGDKELLRDWFAMSCLTRYGYSGRNGCLRVYGAEYSFEPRVRCSAEEEITETVRHMGASGVESFDLVLTAELYDRVSAEGFAVLNRLAKDAGMTDCSFSYSSGSHVIYYTGAVIASEVVPLNTVGEAIAYLERCAEREDETVNLFCSPALYAKLMEGISDFSILNNDLAYIYDLLSQAGLYDCSVSRQPQVNLISVTVNSYYPGSRILRRALAGDLTGLTAREKKTLDIARQWVEEARGATERETAIRLHDRLCEHVTYTMDDEDPENDTAVGALLNGRADCDGYSDAYCLLCGLAGLNARRQHGDSREQGWMSFRSATHMWNLLQLDGTWRLVDVTWDDQENGIVYTWFDLGEDRARLGHIWNSEMTVPLLEKTDPSTRPQNEYAVSSAQQLEDAVRSAISRGQTSFDLYFTSEAAAEELMDSVLEVCRKYCPGSFRYSRNDTMRVYTIRPQAE